MYHCPSGTGDDLTRDQNSPKAENLKVKLWGLHPKMTDSGDNFPTSWMSLFVLRTIDLHSDSGLAEGRDIREN